MKITFMLNKGVDDCIVQVEDSAGTKNYTLYANKNDENTIVTS